MIYPRFIAQFFAWFGGYFWLPCPVCKEPFAGFESTAGAAVVVKESDGEHMYCVCPRASCQAEGQRQVQEYMQGWKWFTQPGYEMTPQHLAEIKRSFAAGMPSKESK